MSQNESAAIVQDNQNSGYGAILRRTSTHNFDNIRPSTPPLHRIETAPLISQSVLSTSTIQSSSDQMVSTISTWSKIGFGFGHIFNDLCAGVWFSYLLLFMKGALRMSGTESGAMMMLGQVGDALATPIVGFLVDKFGTKQRWHIFGTFLVFITFPMIFSLCPMCSVWPSWWHVLYFSVVILLFQIGWPIVQVSHLAIIPEMARTQKDRTQLTSVRYSASVIANVIVFIVTWVVLRSNRTSDEAKITEKDAYRFRDISLILTFIGLCTTVVFQFSLTFSGYGLRRLQAYNNRRASLESRSSYRRLSDSNDPDGQPITMHAPPQRRPKNFFKSIKIYQNGLLYVFSRIFTTTALVYIPLWLNDRLVQISKVPGLTERIDTRHEVEHIAIVPMVQYLASFVSSLLMDKSHHVLGHKSLYLLGSLACIFGCFLVETSISIKLSNARLYSIATLFGAGSSITMISSLCLIANMIGKHAEQSGFIYSAVTFADKLITGVAVLVIESFKCKDRATCPDYYKNVLARACGGAAILGVLTLFTLFFYRRRAPVRSI
ncbi:major facilitator superfamily domain-containing protein 12-like isoform X2 [Contarinia nasturtii]|nr:major facilitator superfamily domain-containing protein 12-like isoform X2 [Contarinia nasturtii]XP_031617575.1 major facilitator superfamily domain-containing protein 12-like isoform X2 [Contarinia nasturtii]XP_031617576.1 major facilitator superfamily domain-containing protein 12-like isoform X2 [Contarinia nasturtii]XP_031617577.1 major facilitator superfamily domain-containing protein 12-like isoform X2 [Contarinia nasturtii]XP_031617578.1 major facilitator superfamily domain-containing 